jgi:hypothetical protein
LKIKNLAYLALLAGWIYFCYWLYAEGISPRLHRHQETSWPEYSADIPFPLAYRWASDVPLAGLGFATLQEQNGRLDSLDEIVIIRGYYFRDEATDESLLLDLGRRRIKSALTYFDINTKRILTEVLVQEITADVKANPFEAVRFERIKYSEMASMTGDTFELCFPVSDSLRLPQIGMDRLHAWIDKGKKQHEHLLHIVGTADGSGIAEPADMAMDRAMYIKKQIMNTGWKEEQIILSTWQRNHPLTLRNRCVVIYFE